MNTRTLLAAAAFLATSLAVQAEITQGARATVVAVDAKASTMTVMVQFQDEKVETQRTVAWDKDTKFLSETAPGKPDVPSKVSAIKPGSKIYTLMTDRSSNGKTFWFQEVTLLK